MDDENPFNICTWDVNADCDSCYVKEKLNCKFDRKLLAGFITYVIPFFFCGIFGMVYTAIVTGIWWFLIGYGIFLVLFFTVIEIRILCRHCPYYAKEGKTIHCHANEGLPRLWKYDPKPLSRIEKLAFLACLAFLGFFPIFTEIYGIWYISMNYASYGFYALLGLIGIAVASLITVLAWLSNLQIFYCPSCINFSCPLNRVPEDDVNAYLEKNPVMKDAWEKCGYRLKK